MLAKIWVQKWVHFGFLQSVQGWAEYRRTKHRYYSFIRLPCPVMSAAFAAGISFQRNLI